MDAPSETVRHDDPYLILVDDDDRVIGHERRAKCHDGAGLLHRAFSVLLFDPQGRVLLQQRAGGKRLWPGYWSNACCGHPEEGEETGPAAERRLHEELGVQVPLQPLFRHRYALSFGSAGSERESCGVFLGRCADDAPVPAPLEVAALRWIAADELDVELSQQGAFTPWFQLLWQRARDEHGEALEPWAHPRG